MDNFIEDLKLSKSFNVSLEDELKESYKRYAISVIISRALPDIRDGLKPVHRRILYAMHEQNWTEKYVKCARIVGDVMGKYHPHGDSSIYDALVRLAQPFSLRYPLIASQGNFGSIDGDSQAAMRYTEAKLQSLTSTFFKDLNQETITFVPNYDESEEEPSVLPVSFPQLAVNGASGVAVAYSTNIPPHNLCEINNATIALLHNPDLHPHELAKICPAPDFPTGGTVCGIDPYKTLWHSSNVRYILRGNYTYNEEKHLISFSSIPYQTLKSQIIDDLKELCEKNTENPQRIPGLINAFDNSQKENMEICIKISPNADKDFILNRIFQQTNLCISYTANFLVIKDKKPQEITLKDYILSFIEFRKTILRTKILKTLKEKRHEAHLTLGRMIAVSMIENIIEILKNATSQEEAVEKLCKIPYKPTTEIFKNLWLVSSDISYGDPPFYLSKKQAENIMQMPISRITNFNQKKIEQDCLNAIDIIKNLKENLEDTQSISKIIEAELLELNKKYGDTRRTLIGPALTAFNQEETIERQKTLIEITKDNWIRQTPLHEYEEAKRATKGQKIQGLKQDDAIKIIYSCQTRDRLIILTDKLRVYPLLCWHIPNSQINKKGRPISGFTKIPKDENITHILSLGEDIEKADNIVFISKKSRIRLTKAQSLWGYDNGKIATPEDFGEIATILSLPEEKDLVLVSHQNKIARLSYQALPDAKSNRTSLGVSGLKLKEDDYILSATYVSPISLNTEEKRAYHIALQKNEEDQTPQDKAILQTYKNFDEDICLFFENGNIKSFPSYKIRRSAGRRGQGQNCGSPKTHPIQIFRRTESYQILSQQGRLLRLNQAEIPKSQSLNGIGVIGLKLNNSDRIIDVVQNS